MTPLNFVLFALNQLDKAFQTLPLPDLPKPPPNTDRICAERRAYAIDRERPYLNSHNPYGDIFNGTYLEDYTKMMDKYEKILHSIIKYKYWKSIIELINDTYDLIRKTDERPIESENLDNQAIDILLHHCDFPFKHNDYCATYINVFYDMCDDLDISKPVSDDLEAAVKKFITMIGNS